MFRTIAIAVLVILSLAAPGATHADASDISAATRSVVRVAVFSSSNGQRTLVGHGSGVVVAPDRIVTNAHVVADAQYDQSVTFVVIPSEGSKSYEATLVAVANSKDLALMKLNDGVRLIPASIYTGLVGDGADVLPSATPQMSMSRLS